MQTVKNAWTSTKNSCSNTGKSIKRNYNKRKIEKKVKNDEIRRQRTAIYKFKVIKKMKQLHDFCLEETYDRDLRKIYTEILNDVLIKKIIVINSSIEILFKFSMNKEEIENQFVDPLVVFVKNCVDNYNLEELKLIDRYVSKYLK